MLFASIRQGPIGDALLKSVNEQAAKSVTGFLKLVRTDRWVAVVATNWWAANKALDLSDPVFELAGAPLSSASIDAALESAFSGSAGQRLYSQGDLKSLFDNATILASEFSVAPGLHLALEPMCATARISDGVAEIWMPTQAPALARAAIADALGMTEHEVTLYPLHAGGSFGRKMDFEAGVQAALVARDMGRPVQLLWSRLEDVVQDRPSAPAHRRLAREGGRSLRDDPDMGPDRPSQVAARSEPGLCRCVHAFGGGWDGTPLCAPQLGGGSLSCLRRSFARLHARQRSSAWRLLHGKLHRRIGASGRD
jgi:isoquinoline 1-oxidoreductase beta subunit